MLADGTPSTSDQYFVISHERGDALPTVALAILILLVLQLGFVDLSRNFVRQTKLTQIIHSVGRDAAAREVTTDSDSALWNIDDCHEYAQTRLAAELEEAGFHEISLLTSTYCQQGGVLFLRLVVNVDDLFLGFGFAGTKKAPVVREAIFPIENVAACRSMEDMGDFIDALQDGTNDCYP